MDLIAKIKSLTKEQKLASVLLIITLIPLIIPFGFTIYGIFPMYVLGGLVGFISHDLEPMGSNFMLIALITLIASIFVIYYLLKKNNFKYISGFMLWLIYLELLLVGFFTFVFVLGG
jgi:Ca2+/H+ antiporter